MKKITCLAILIGYLLPYSPVVSQTSITLEECYTLAREHYPMSRQRDLISQSEAYSVENASKGYLPQITINGQATYQSEVFRLPIELPGMATPLVPKDQYKLYGELTQVIYDGGITDLKKQNHETQARVEQQGLEVELYALKERIQQLYFGILLLNEQIRQAHLLQQDIELGLKKVQASIDQGTALKSSAAVLKVEVLRVNQQFIEYTSTRKAYLDMLGQMINRPLDENTQLIKPEAEVHPMDIQRPELTWYQLQSESLNLQNNLLQTENRPKVHLFFQGGLGKPGLNMLDDQVKGYYLGGIRFAWPLTGYYTVKNERADISIQQQRINLKRETFLYQTNLRVSQENAEINKLRELLSFDDEIIGLQNTIKNTALTQMENGVITANDYLEEVNSEDKARQNKILHEIQLVMAQYSLQTTIGI